MIVLGAVATLLAAVSLQPVATGLQAPLYVTAPRSEPGRLYVVEQGGLVRVVVNGKVRVQPFLDVRAKTAAGGERGLLSIAFSPGYAKNRLFAVDYTDVNGDTRVVQYRSDGTKAILGSARQLLFVRQPYANHNGGQLQYGPDGLLYVGMGDGGSGGDPGNRAQNLSSRLGKLLRYRDGHWQVAAYGLRNPWRFSFDRGTGGLWIGDVGQNAWEEVDYRPKGFGLTNFGWHVLEGRTPYQSGQTPNPAGTLVGPVAVYHDGDDGCSITGGYAYSGTAAPSLRGRYVFGDYCSGRIWSLGPGGAMRREPLEVPQLTSFGEDTRGELYAVSGAGTVFRIAR